MSQFKESNDIDIALNEVKSILNKNKETSYFEYHEMRYRQMANAVLNLLPKGAKLLDIGSHYLHAAIILKKLGYEVDVVDVDAFYDLDFVKERRQKFGLNGIRENYLETFQSIAEKANEYDGILFMEVIEHITFNPVLFWQNLYRVLKAESIIYITTPNSMALPNYIRSLSNLFRLKGIGIPVKDILRYETYGHHWKEYSKSEITTYFNALSEDFEVNTRLVSFYRNQEGGIRDRLWYGLAKLGQNMYFFAPCLEVEVIVKKKKGIQLESPFYL